MDVLGKQNLQGLTASDRPLNKIFFTNASNGYIPGYKTLDSGLNWIKQDSFINQWPHNATDIWFANNSTGFITGNDYWGFGTFLSGRIHKTILAVLLSALFNQCFFVGLV